MGRSQNTNTNINTRNVGRNSFQPSWMTLRGSTLQWRKTADVVKTAKELELEVEPEDVTELLKFYDKTLTDKE